MQNGSMAEATTQEATIPQSREGPKATGPARALERMGLKRDIDLALHVPLRYEDETRLTRIADAHDGDNVQVEGVVTDSQVAYRPRRQLVARIHDDSGSLVLRFMNFYPSHQKALARGVRIRARGDVRSGFFGREMVHPSFKAVEAGAPLSSVLTPVYPTVSQLPQAYLRKAIASALQRAPLAEVLPAGVVPAGLPALRDALQRVHHPPADATLAALLDHSDSAWQRLKFEELLAQQLSQHEARLRACVVARAATARGARTPARPTVGRAAVSADAGAATRGP